MTLSIDKPKYEADVSADAQSVGVGPWDRLIELCYGAAESDTFLHTIVSVLSGLKTEPWTEYLYLDRVLGMIDGLGEAMWQMVKRGYSALMLDNPEGSLSKITSPMLAIFGGADQYLPVEESIYVYTRWPQSSWEQRF